MTGLFGQIVPLTLDGILDYAARVHREAVQATHDLRAEVALLKHRLAGLERELRLLKLPITENWSA